MTAWLIAVLMTVLMQTGLYAQLAPLPGDYAVHFGDVSRYFRHHILDISDLHYLGVNRGGRDEFLAVFVHWNYPEPIPDDPLYYPIYVVYFDYGGLPLSFRIRNVLAFRPRVQGSLTPSYPRRAQLVYQPPGDDPQLHPAKWFLLATNSFLFVLPDRFYQMTPEELAPRISGKYLSYNDYDKPVFGMPMWIGEDSQALPVGVARRGEGLISSILVGSQRNSHYDYPRIVALNGQGDVIGAWEIQVIVSCEEPPCIPPCEFSSTRPVIPIGLVGGGGGATNVGIFAPFSPTSSTDEYAILFGIGNGSAYPQEDTTPAAMLMRFGLDGNLRWARFYRHLDSGGYINPAYNGAFFVAVDDSNPNGQRLLFQHVYGAFLVYVDAANGNPLWAYRAPFVRDTYGWFLDHDTRKWWFHPYIISINDNGILSIEAPYRCRGLGGPACYEIMGDRTFITTVMGNYLVFADDWNRTTGNCEVNNNFVPGIVLWDWTRQTLVPIPNNWTRVQTCTGEFRHPLALNILSVRNRIVERPATLEVRGFEYPITVECKMDPCEGHVCPNGVGWSRGDVAPYEVNNPPYLLGDCCVDDADLLAVLFNFGNAYNYTTQFKPGAGDVNCDEIVDDTDLLIVLFNFGEGCGG
jgi:hypothetical protein